MFNAKQEMMLMEERKRRLLREARMQQLIRLAQHDRTQAGERLMALLGDLMIAGGEKLKARSSYAIKPQRT